MQNQTLITNFLAQKHLGIAGVSRSGKKFGNIILKTLTSKGYNLLPVHPEVAEINGLPCTDSVMNLPEEVEGLILVIPPERTEELVQQIPGSGIKRVWMQQGSESSKAVEFCSNNGIDVVSGECILMFAEPKGLHKFHRWLLDLFGKTSK